MSSLKCFYHPSIDAVDKCSRCNKLLCLQDKKVSYPYGYSNNTYNPAVPVVYCPECYENILIQGRTKFNHMNRWSILIVLIPTVVFFIVFGSMFLNFMNFQNQFSSFPGSQTQNSFNMFTIIIPLIVGIMIIVMVGVMFMVFRTFVRSKKGINEEINRTQNEVEYLSNPTTNDQNLSLDIQFCRSCGTRLDNTAMYCPRCGAKI